MRYKLKLNKNVKNNFINLPTTSQLRNSLQQRAFSLDTNNVSAIKVTTFASDQFYFGFAGGVSEENNSVEISEDVGRLLDLHDGDIVTVSIEYSFEKLKEIELEPLTADDFEIIEKNSEFIEEQLLNQLGCFYDQQLFLIFLQGANVRLKSKVTNKSAKCYFMTVASELHIQPKTRSQLPAVPEEQKEEEQQNRRDIPPVVDDVKIISRLQDCNKVNLPLDTILISRVHSRLYSNGDVIKLVFEPRQKLCHLEYNEFQTLKQTGKQLNSENEELYFQVKLSEADGDIPDNSSFINYKNYETQIRKIEKVQIIKVKQPIKHNVYNLLCIFTTNIEMLRNGIQIHLSHKDTVFKIVNQLLEQHIKKTVSLQKQVIINEKTLINIDQSDLVQHIQEIIENNKEKNDDDEGEVIILRRILKSIEKAKESSLEFTFQIDKNAQASYRPQQLTQPKYVVINNQSNIQHLVKLAFNPKSKQKNDHSGRLNKLEQIISNKLYQQSVIDKIIEKTVKQRVPLLLYGPQNVGKTYILKNIIKPQLEQNKQKESSTYVEYIDCNSLSAHLSQPESIEFALEYLFLKYNEALQLKPSMIVLDNVSALCPAISQDEQFNIVEQLKSLKVSNLITNLIEREEISFIGITRHYMQINTKLLDVGIFDTMIEMNAPSKEQRYSLIKEVLAPEEFQKKEIQLQKFAQLTEYFMAKDLSIVFKEVMDQLIEDHSKFEEIMLKSIQDYKNSCFPSTQNVSENVPDWETEIGGLYYAKEQIEEIFGITQKYSLFFKGQRVNQGLLLYGPPGCGKTYLAAAIAKRFNINFISVKGPELLNKYIGASEQNVRELFERANASKPTILFFDEFDSLVPRRGSGQTVVTDRIVNQFLCYLDGVEGRDGIFVMAASSRPDMVDVALLRPGRIDKSVYCGFPNEKERRDIIKIYLNKFNFKSKDLTAFDAFLDHLAIKTENFTSADIKGLVQNAQLGKMSSILKEQIVDKDNIDFSINEDDIMENMKTFVRGMNEQERQRFLGIYAKYQDKGGAATQEQIKNQKQIQY